MSRGPSSQLKAKLEATLAKIRQLEVQVDASGQSVDPAARAARKQLLVAGWELLALHLSAEGVVHPHLAKALRGRLVHALLAGTLAKQGVPGDVRAAVLEAAAAAAFVPDDDDDDEQARLAN